MENEEIFVTTLNDSGEGSFREAIKIANETGNNICFSVSGIIILKTELPKIKTNGIKITGNNNIEIDFNRQSGIKIYGNRVEISGVCLTNSSNAAIEIHSSRNVVKKCFIGCDQFSSVKSNRIGILIESGCYNKIGDNPELIQEYFSNVISGNIEEGIKIVNSHSNEIINNLIGLNIGGTEALPNKNGIVLFNSHYTKIGGIEYVDRDGNINNPTGNKGTEPGVFVRPLFGNIISGNEETGVLIYSSENCQLSGNFIGTNFSGISSIPNKHGVLIEKSRLTSLIGCKIYNNPFVYYNVISGNKKCGILIQNSTLTTIQGNFIGISATNLFAVPNTNGVVIAGNSSYTTFGGRIPLGNVVAGNLKNGIVLTENSYSFTSFNTFAGLSAFGPIVPNGENGFLIEANSTNNTIRTNVISGNMKNGIEIKDNVTNIKIVCNIIGLDTDGSKVFSNQQNGILIRGKSKRIIIENDSVPSIIPKNCISGNIKNGISIEGEASEVQVTGSLIGFDLSATRQIGEQKNAIFISEDSKHNTIGNINSRNYLTSKQTPAILVAGKENIITENSINTNILLERVPEHVEDFVDISIGNSNLYYANDGTYY